MEKYSKGASRGKKVQSKGREHVVAIGIDLSDKTGQYYAICDEGTGVEEGKIALRRAAVIEWARQFPPCVIAIEAGTHSPWLSRTLAECGHEVIVANPVKVALITQNKRKTDPIDAEYLARMARFDRKLLHEIKHRGEQAQTDLQVIRSREIAVGARTKLIGHVRGTVKSYGERLPACSSEAFVNRVEPLLPESLRTPLASLLGLIDQLSETIDGFDRQVRKLIDERYPEAHELMQITGVGPITSLTYVLVIDDPKRFATSRSVGAFVGFTPAKDQSGQSDPQRGITKCGDRLLRRLLVQSAHYILGPERPDCDLRRHGEAIASRGGKNAKKRAAVAVARKLAVLLHRLWIRGETYDPLFNAKRRLGATAVAA